MPFSCAVEMWKVWNGLEMMGVWSALGGQWAHQSTCSGGCRTRVGHQGVGTVPYSLVRLFSSFSKALR